MAGLLDAIMNGGLPVQDESDPQGAMLADLLKRLGADPAAVMQNSVGMTPAIGAHIAAREAATARPAEVAPDPSAGRFAQPALRGAIMPEQTESLPAITERSVEPRPQAGVAYQPPESSVVPDDVARREQANATLRGPAPQQRPAARADADAEPSLGERLSAFGRGYDKGGLIGAIGDAMTGGQDNTTVRALMQRLNVDRDTATAMLKSPQLAPLLFGRSGPPQIVNIPGAYGQDTSMVWNAQTQKLEPLSTLLGTDARAPSATAAPVTPVLGGTQPGATPGDGRQPTQTQPDQRGAGGVPLAPTARSVAPNMTEDGQFVIGNAVAKPPDGYVHKLAPSGAGYLYDRSGRPIFESKAEVDARGRNTETRLVATDKQTKAASQVAGALEQLQRMPTEFGTQAFERSIGPWSATDPNPDSAAGIWGTGISVGNLGRMAARTIGEVGYGIEGGAAPTEVRDRVETVTKNLAAVMKPLVRAPGEGAWSDKDQANLEAQIGSLTRSRSVDEYNRRLADIHENIRKVFQLNVPDRAAVATRTPQSPITAEEEMTAIERYFGRQMK
jgi:hypothetical protein